jgi:multicomponent Na+:H+ antiporter subunit G
MTLFRLILALVLAAGGCLFMLLAAVGLVRMPDVLTRMHASSKAATLGAALVVAAVAVTMWDWAIALRATLVSLFLLITAPVAAHAIARASYLAGVPLAEETVMDELAGRYDQDTHELSGTSADPTGAG